MTSFRARQKWRPSLSFVIFAVLALVAVLPLLGLFFFRLYDNQLIRQTQAELIAQSRVLAVIYARDVQAQLANGIPLGAAVPPEALPDPSSILPATIFCGDDPTRFLRPSRQIRLTSPSARGSCLSCWRPRK